MTDEVIEMLTLAANEGVTEMQDVLKRTPEIGWICFTDAQRSDLVCRIYDMLVDIAENTDRDRE